MGYFFPKSKNKKFWGVTYSQKLKPEILGWSPIPKSKSDQKVKDLKCKRNYFGGEVVLKIPNYPPRLWTVHGRVMVSPSARVRLVGVEMMVAMGEVAGVDEAKVRRARGRPIGPMPIRPISDLGLQTSIDQLMHSTYYLSLVANGYAAVAVSLYVNKCVRRQHRL